MYILIYFDSWKYTLLDDLKGRVFDEQFRELLRANEDFNLYLGILGRGYFHRIGKLRRVYMYKILKVVSFSYILSI